MDIISIHLSRGKTMNDVRDNETIFVQRIDYLGVCWIKKVLCEFEYDNLENNKATK